MTQRRWWRIIPVALIMYTISYVDRTNIALALDRTHSTMMQDLLMDDNLKGQVAGIFFVGYVLLQIPGGLWAARWSARKIVSVFLVSWGVCAVGCGLAQTFRQFEAARFLLGVAESGVYPATLVLLASWFPRTERARANAYWNLCQPLAVAASSPVTSVLLHQYGWRQTLILEGSLPFLWLPIWWWFIRDHPHEAKWISTQEQAYLENTLRAEAASVESAKGVVWWHQLARPMVWLMIIICFLYNSFSYGCMTFLTEGLHLKDQGFSALTYGIIFAGPYAVTAVLMVIVSRHSDKTHERRKHLTAMYALSGACLIASILLKHHFWLSYACMCLAIPGPFVGLAPFFAIPSETLPRNIMALAMGLVNACGNFGGFVGPKIVGWWKSKLADHSIDLPFSALGVGMLVAAGLALLLPKSPRPIEATRPGRPANVV